MATPRKAFPWGERLILTAHYSKRGGTCGEIMLPLFILDPEKPCVLPTTSGPVPMPKANPALVNMPPNSDWTPFVGCIPGGRFLEWRHLANRKTRLIERRTRITTARPHRADETGYSYHLQKAVVMCVDQSDERRPPTRAEVLEQLKLMKATTKGARNLLNRISTEGAYSVARDLLEESSLSWLPKASCPLSRLDVPRGYRPHVIAFLRGLFGMKSPNFTDIKLWHQTGGGQYVVGNVATFRQLPTKDLTSEPEP